MQTTLAKSLAAAQASEHNPTDVVWHSGDGSQAHLLSLPWPFYTVGNQASLSSEAFWVVLVAATTASSTNSLAEDSFTAVASAAAVFSNFLAAASFAVVVLPPRTFWQQLPAWQQLLPRLSPPQQLFLPLDERTSKRANPRLDSGRRGGC